MPMTRVHDIAKVLLLSRMIWLKRPLTPSTVDNTAAISRFGRRFFNHNASLRDCPLRRSHSISKSSEVSWTAALGRSIILLLALQLGVGRAQREGPRGTTQPPLVSVDFALVLFQAS